MAKILTGTVVSARSTNTITVSVETKLRHPKYQKVITRHKKFRVHSTRGDVKIGDMVAIAETRPISKNKHFTLVDRVIKK